MWEGVEKVPDRFERFPADGDHILRPFPAGRKYMIWYTVCCHSQWRRISIRVTIKTWGRVSQGDLASWPAQHLAFAKNMLPMFGASSSQALNQLTQ